MYVSVAVVVVRFGGRYKLKLPVRTSAAELNVVFIVWTALLYTLFAPFVNELAMDDPVSATIPAVDCAKFPADEKAVLTACTAAANAAISGRGRAVVTTVNCLGESGAGGVGVDWTTNAKANETIITLVFIVDVDDQRRISNWTHFAVRFMNI